MPLRHKLLEMNNLSGILSGILIFRLTHKVLEMNALRGVALAA